jgi:hypothetical protein
MTRPRRLYTTDDGKFYYLIDGKKKFVKAPAGISQKQIAKINIKNIVNAPSAKRIKRRRKRIEPAYGKKVGGVLQKSDTGGLPLYFFNPQKNIPTLEQQAKASDDTTTKQLTNLIQGQEKFQQKLLQGFTAVFSSSRIPATITPEQPTGQLTGQPTGGPKIQGVRGRPKGSKNKKKTGGFTFNQPAPAPAPAPATEPAEFEIGEVDEDDGGVSESKQGAKGTGDGDGLYNDEIAKVVKKRIKNYVPVIASDEINELPRYVARGDKRFGFVINTNPSTSDGSGNDGYRTGHWRAVYINNEDDYPTVEYFDPLTEGKMPPELITMCRKIAMKMNPSMMFKYKQNMLRRQSKMTSNCGWHSVKFLDDRYNGVPWSEATGYTDYMERLNSAPDDSHDGEKDISKYIKKYESYI